MSPVKNFDGTTEEGKHEPYEFLEYPRVMYRGKVDLNAADNVGADAEQRIVNNKEEQEAALKDGFRLTLAEENKKK